VLVNFSFCKTH